MVLVNDVTIGYTASEEKYNCTVHTPAVYQQKLQICKLKNLPKIADEAIAEHMLLVLL